jgi:hypothetical protein
MVEMQALLKLLALAKGIHLIDGPDRSLPRPSSGKTTGKKRRSRSR